jgi:hypothetical protein
MLQVSKLVAQDKQIFSYKYDTAYHTSAHKLASRASRTLSLSQAHAHGQALLNHREIACSYY